MGAGGGQFGGFPCSTPNLSLYGMGVGLGSKPGMGPAGPAVWKPSPVSLLGWCRVFLPPSPSPFISFLALAELLPCSELLGLLLRLRPHLEPEPVTCFGRGWLWQRLG